MEGVFKASLSSCAMYCKGHAVVIGVYLLWCLVIILNFMNLQQCKGF